MSQSGEGRGGGGRRSAAAGEGGGGGAGPAGGGDSDTAELVDAIRTLNSSLQQSTLLLSKLCAAKGLDNKPQDTHNLPHERTDRVSTVTQ